MPTRSFLFPFDRTFLLPIVAFPMLLFPIGAFAQPGGYSSSDKGAIKRYEAGLECMRMRKWECAQGEFTKAAAADEKFAEPALMLAEMHEMRGQDDPAIARYREALAIASRVFPTAQLFITATVAANTE